MGGDEDGTSSGIDETSTSSDGGTSTTTPGGGGADTSLTSGGTGTAETLTSGHSETGDTASGETDQTSTTEPPSCAGIPIPQPEFDYDEGLVERIDADHIAVELVKYGLNEWDESYRWLFELGPDELAPGIYTVSVEQECFYGCPSWPGPVDVVVEIVSLDDCLAAAFLDVPEWGCNGGFFIWGCGGFVEPVL